MTAATERRPSRPLQPHGTPARFAAGCTCDACVAADATGVPVAPAIGPSRMARALVARGYSIPYLTRRTRVPRPVLVALLEQDGGFTPLTLARTIRVLFVELRDVHPFRLGLTQSQRRHSLRLAERNGWAPPGAWDDVDIDDPRAVPFVEERAPSRPRPLVVLEDYEWFRANIGGDDRAAAKYLGMELDTLRQNLRRAQVMPAGREPVAA